MNTKLDTKVDNVAWKEPWLHVMFFFVSPSPSDIPCGNMRDFGSLGDGVQRPFNQHRGQEANDDLDAAVKTVRDMVSSLRLDVDARRRKVGCAVVRWSTEDVVCLFVLLTVQIVCDFVHMFSQSYSMFVFPL